MIPSQKVLFVSSIIPDEPRLITPAFSRAGNMCMENLLHGLNQSETVVDKILSMYPIPSFPGSKRFYFSKTRLRLNSGQNIKMLPFINVTPIKQLSVGIASYLEIIKWGKKTEATDKIIFTYNITVPPGIFLLAAARRIGARIVAMIYDVNIPGETVPSGIPYIIDYWQHKKILRFYDGLVVITNEIAQDFAPDVPYICVEGGIAPDLIEQYVKLEKTPRHDSDHFTIVAAGGLKEANGIHEIIEAFRLLEGEEYRLHIAGQGPLESLVRDAAEKDHRIVYHGFLNFEEVLKLYANADVLLNMRLTKRLNTRYFFPSKIMEYLTSGVPIISTCPGAMADEYGEYAYLLQDETPESLASMIKTVSALPKEQRIARGMAARQYMLENKTWDVQTEKISGFLKQILKQKQLHGKRKT